MASRDGRLRVLCAGAVLLAATPSAAGQVADSTRARPGRIFGIDRLQRHAAWDLADRLASLGGTFLHDFGTDGWPDAWSPEGLDPARVTLRVASVPMDDPITGAPAWDLAPLPVLDRIDVAAVDLADAFSARGALRTFDADTALTEARYRSGGGLQAVSVVHVQRRSVGRGRHLDVTFSYAGAGSAGEYEGSRMRRKRQLLGRVGTGVGRWTLAATLLTNRHRVGAHGGVVAPGATYETIYNRLLATTAHPDAVRERYRSDLSFSAARTVFGRPLELVAYRTQHLLRYVQDLDSTWSRVVRYGFEASLPLWTGPVPLSATLAARSDSAPAGGAVSAAGAGSRETSLGFGGRAAAGPLRLDYVGGLRAGDGDLRGAAHGGAGISASGLDIELQASSAPLTRSPVERFGFGTTPAPDPGVEPGRLTRLSAAGGVGAGALRLVLRAFSTARSGGVALIAEGEGFRAAVPVASLRTTGATLLVHIREEARSGLYGLLSATTFRTSGDPFAGSLPDLSGQAATGWRGTLFQGDAVVDARLEARAWTTMRGRRLHAPTGLLVLADDASRDVPGSVILDARIDVDVRGATLHLGLENLLSGTDLVVGNQLVLDYPVPERRFRIGVFWPIPE